MGILGQQEKILPEFRNGTRIEAIQATKLPSLPFFLPRILEKFPKNNNTYTKQHTVWTIQLSS